MEGAVDLDVPPGDVERSGPGGAPGDEAEAFDEPAGRGGRGRAASGSMRRRRRSLHLGAGERVAGGESGGPEASKERLGRRDEGSAELRRGGRRSCPAVAAEAVLSDGDREEGLVAGGGGRCVGEEVVVASRSSEVVVVAVVLREPGEVLFEPGWARRGRSRRGG